MGDTMPLGDRETCLYRMFDKDQQLLYVGISISAPRRMSEHEHDKSWWPDVVGISVERFPTRIEALAAEALAISGEHPLHNVAGATSAQQARARASRRTQATLIASAVDAAPPQSPLESRVRIEWLTPADVRRLDDEFLSTMPLVCVHGRPYYQCIELQRGAGLSFHHARVFYEGIPGPVYMRITTPRPPDWDWDL